MRRTLLFTSLLACPWWAQSQEPAPFAPIEHLVGHCWSATFEDGKRDIQCYESMYDGKFVRNTHVVVGDGKPSYGGLSIYSADPDSGRVRFHYFTRTGAVSTGELLPDGQGYRIPERHVEADGQVTELETLFRKEGEYGYLAQTRKRSGDGWTPMWSLHYRRSDAPDAPRVDTTLRHNGGTWQLAFSTQRDGNWEIYRLDIDGQAVNLTNSPVDEWVWSAHGGTLYLLSNRRGESEDKGWRAFRLNGRGGTAERMGDTVLGSGYVDCRPDASFCVAEIQNGERTRIARFVDGRLVSKIDTGPGDSGYPQLSPDGSQVLYRYRETKDAEWELWLADTDGDNARQLTDDAAGNLADPGFSGEGPARFSPDGRHIAWSRGDDHGKQDVWIMDADGGHPRNLTNQPDSNDNYPAFSPDGRWITFSSDRDGGTSEIYLMDADGGNQRRVTLHPGDNAGSLWVKVQEAMP